ncbi:MAG TPA: FtsQ-type POTRA domain-containing protein [Candidatus Moranbacteria bacterium]|nr:FtsQ-type POTRA domain-containing protein [Candidatus Moranbacteria bacterium]
MVKPLNIRSQKPREKNRPKKRGVRRILFYFISVIFLGVVIYILFFSSLMSITKIKISGNKNITQQLLLRQINPQISGKYFQLLNKNNFLLVKISRIKKILSSQFVQIRKIEIKKKFPSYLEINIVERVPTLIVCSNNQKYILDENGQVYDKINSLPKKDLIILTDESHRPISLGDYLLDKKYLSYILKIKKIVEEETGLKLKNNFWTPSLISGDIRTETQTGWKIYFNEQNNLSEEVEMLKAVLNKKIISVAQRAKLEYIDLRIKNKVYYKFRGDDENTKKDDNTSNYLEEH